MSAGTSGRTQLTAAIDVIAVAAVTAGLLLLARRVWVGMDGAADAIAVTLMLAAGYVMADLLTGFVHWFCDTFFEEDTPLIGAALIASFREHHRDPLIMTRHGFLVLTGSSFRALAPLLMLLAWKGEAAPVALTAFVVALAAGAVLTNFLHRWAHEPAPPRAARILQRVGLVLTPERHAHHHQPPHHAGYCVTSGWLNPVCERLRLWSRAETALTALGVPVSRDHHRASAAKPSAG